jgi:hypothetical protein
MSSREFFDRARSPYAQFDAAGSWTLAGVGRKN